MDEIKRRAAGHLLIGLQLRTGKYDVYRFLEPEDVELFWACAEDFATGNAKYLVYVSTDDDGVKRAAAERFGSRLLAVDAKASFNHHEYNASADSSALVVDHFMLSTCDHLVVTAGSTFGGMAAMRAGLVPHFVRGGAQSRNETCKLASVTDPPVGYKMPAPAW